MADQLLLFAAERQAFLEFEARQDTKESAVAGSHSRFDNYCDEALLKAYAWNCDNAAFRELHDRHAAGLTRFIKSRFSLCSSDADEITQAAWIKVARYCQVPVQSFVKWLGKMAFRCGLDYLRANGRDEDSQQDEAMSDPADSSAVEPIEFLSEDERRTQVVAALGEIDARHRSIIALRYFDNLSVVSIADLLGVSLRTAWRKIGDAVASIESQIILFHGKPIGASFIVEANRCDGDTQAASPKPPRLRQAG